MSPQWDPHTQTTLSPHSQEPLVSRTYPSESELDALISKAAEAHKAWAKTSIADRVAIGRKFITTFQALLPSIPLELTLQMGRPVSQSPGEVRGTVERTQYMLDIAESALGDISLADTDKPGFKRYMKRVPVGVVFIISPWNFPYLTAINALVPALIAGNSVILKPSPQTPLTAERLAEAWTAAGLPEGVLQVAHLSPALTARAIAHPNINFVSFTGSVEGGRSVLEEAARRKVDGAGIVGVGLELGGKDPAYVASDAGVEYSASELVDGAFFNSGQSCCSIERIYVHTDVYDRFVDKFVEVTKTYKLGDPTKPETNLGPVVSLASAERIRKQVADAVAKGAKQLIPEDLFPIAKAGTTYVAPQVLVDVDHSMEVMTEETFGPVVGIQRVSSDEEAIKLMNDSRYGLTASVWSGVQDKNGNVNEAAETRFLRFVDELETGTVFLNRCDYLDPALAWTGVKDSGRGVTLSKFGYDQVTRVKSVHMKIKTGDTYFAVQMSNVEDSNAPAEHRGEPLLLEAGSNSSSDATKLDVSGTHEQNLKLDALGPMVVNSDGTMSRIANWDKMTELERERTLRVLSARNKVRLAKQAEETGVDSSSSVSALKEDAGTNASV